MNKSDAVFWSRFGAMLLVLIAFTVSIYVLANRIGNAAFDATENSNTAISERIVPFGHAEIGDPLEQIAALPSATSKTATAVDSGSASAAAVLSGDAVYNQVCTACHAVGVLGAPKLGDIVIWESLLAQGGVEGLVSAAINGKGNMPAKGGATYLSDAEIRGAVAYMLKKMNLSEQ